MSRVRYRKIPTNIWNDVNFVSRSVEEKLVFLCLATNPNTTSIGILRNSVQGLSVELKISIRKIKEAIKNLEDSGLIEYAEKPIPLFVVTGFFEFNNLESPNMAKTWARSFSELPKTEIVLRHYERALRHSSCLKGGMAHALTHALREAWVIQEQEQEQDTGYRIQEQDTGAGAGSGGQVEIPLPADSPEFLRCQCVGGDTFILTEAKLREYEATYGEQLDVRFEARKAFQWLADNPANRKTSAGMPRFLTNWFNRSVDRGGTRKAPRPPASPAPVFDPDDEPGLSRVDWMIHRFHPDIPGEFGWSTMILNLTMAEYIEFEDRTGHDWRPDRYSDCLLENNGEHWPLHAYRYYLDQGHDPIPVLEELYRHALNGRGDATGSHPEAPQGAPEAANGGRTASNVAGVAHAPHGANPEGFDQLNSAPGDNRGSESVATQAEQG